VLFPASISKTYVVMCSFNTSLLSACTCSNWISLLAVLLSFFRPIVEMAPTYLALLDFIPVWSLPLPVVFSSPVWPSISGIWPCSSTSSLILELQFSTFLLSAPATRSSHPLLGWSKCVQSYHIVLPLLLPSTLCYLRAQ
jgi:hypothetical protein